MMNLDLDTVAIRESLNWAQWEMAKHMGVTQPTIYRWEKGAAIPLLARREYERLALKKPDDFSELRDRTSEELPIEPIGETQSAPRRACTECQAPVREGEKTS